MARTKKNKSETKTNKKRVRKTKVEQAIEQPIEQYGPQLLNVKIQSEFEQDDDLDFSHKSIINDENEIFSGEIKTNKSQLKNKYFDTVLDEEDLLQAEFDEIKQKSKKRLISKKTKKTDQTAQAIKESINKRFDDFFDETEKSLITSTVYDGDYHELADKDLIEKANEFSNASELIDEIISNSLTYEQKQSEQINDTLEVIANDINLSQEELVELEQININNFDFDSRIEQKDLLDSNDKHVYEAIVIDEATLKHDIYEPDVLLNVEQPIEINQQLSIQTEIKQEVHPDFVQTQSNLDNHLINSINQTIKIEQNDLDAVIPKINIDSFQEEIIDIHVHDLAKEELTNKQEQNKIKPSYQSTSEVVQYAVDLNASEDEIIKVEPLVDKLSIHSNVDDRNIRYKVSQEDSMKSKELHVDVASLNTKLNSEVKKITKPKKPLDQLEEIPANIREDKYIKQEVENVPLNDHRTFTDLQKPTVNKKPLDQLQQIPVRLAKVDFSTPTTELKQPVEVLKSQIEQVQKVDINQSVDLTEVQRLVNQLEELVKQTQQAKSQTHQNSIKTKATELKNLAGEDEVDLLQNLIDEFDYELEQLEQLNKEFAQEEVEEKFEESDGLVNEQQVDQTVDQQKVQAQSDILIEDLQTTVIDFKPDYKALNVELLDETIHPIKVYDSGWKPEQIDIKYNYSDFDFSDYYKIIDEQTEFKMFCKKSIDYSIAPTLKIVQEDKTSDDDLIELDHNAEAYEQTQDVVDIEVSDWETIENHPTIDFQSLINKNSEKLKYYLEDKSSTTELIDDQQIDQSQEEDFKFEGLDEEITRLIIEQKQNIKHRLISQGEYSSEKLSKELTKKLKEEANKIVVKNISNEFVKINDINKYKKPLVSAEIKPIHPFASKSLKERLITSQKLELAKSSKKISSKSILNDLKNYEFKGANLIYQKVQPKKLTNIK
ncbi:hypothetical protein [[Mycoplasma] imitans]|uniref:hypothetical protein n=1 Tax=[Mycoplasma] imitans TaxID=29560 RepID=UPI000487A3F3|nr:hypothetical protein [[Mycoplasma] imitans]